MKVRLLVACREDGQAQGHCATLARAAGDAIAAGHTTLDDVACIAAQLRPDVILLEHLPGREERVWGTLARLARVSSGSRVLMLCGPCTDRLVTSLVANGACGSVAPGSDAMLLAKAVLAVHRGESWFERSVVLEALRRQLTAHSGGWTAASKEEQLLTAREREVLSLIGAGMSNKEIGRSLSISDQTVKTHLHHIYVKLNRSGRYKAFVATPAHTTTAFRATDGRRPTGEGRNEPAF